jgi:hypothetical protein
VQLGRCCWPTIAPGVGRRRRRRRRKFIHHLLVKSMLVILSHNSITPNYCIHDSTIRSTFFAHRKPPISYTTTYPFSPLHVALNPKPQKQVQIQKKTTQTSEQD